MYLCLFSVDVEFAQLKCCNHVQAEIRKSLLPLYEAIGDNSSLAMKFIRSRVERMSDQWIQAGLRMQESSNKAVATQMRVCVYASATI